MPARVRHEAPGAAAPAGSDHVAPDCRGTNLYRADHGFRALLPLYMPDELRRHLEPHFDAMGELAGGRLDELAATADRNPPVLHARDRFGRDEDWIEYHPAYREMEDIAFHRFGMHAMSHRGGVLGWPDPVPAVGKYAFTYLFVQGEFGLMCPISLSDTSNYLIGRFADDDLKQRFLPRLLSQDPAAIWKGSQFMTEKAGGSDVGRLETVARHEDGTWRLYGDKWFCSNADADVALLLARPEGAPAGTAGVGLFLVPRRLDDGSRNAYRVVRLKDKMGTRSMASGEILLEGAVAYPVGRLDRGVRQMMEQVNLSRLSHGVRAAAMMRRCLAEALVVARHRRAFGRRLIDMPLVRRQLLKLAVPTEQALSMSLYAAATMDDAHAGDGDAKARLRLLTPLIKLRACRDNVAVATGAMEVRGGNGYIEDWTTARLVRDAQVGLLWEGTSNIVALDAIQRAVGRDRAHEALAADLAHRIEQAASMPSAFRVRLAGVLRRAVRLAADCARLQEGEAQARRAAAALYHATTAVLMATEGAALAAAGGDARRLLLARMVLDHRLSPDDPLELDPGSRRDEAVAGLLLDDAPVPAARVATEFRG